ncbi:MAG: D-galactonate transporter [Labilithrix sp.]|nr:D-galactonate transporter [Labilithrix sp.]
MAVSYLDRQVLGVLAPSLTRELHLDEAGYGLVAGAFSGAYLVGAPLAARMHHRIGTRAGLALAVVAWSCVAAAHAAAAGLASLVALRVLLGLAESPSFPGATSVLRNVVPREESARAFGFLFAGSSLGSALAPILATRLSASFGFRGAFVGTALVGALWLVLWAFVSGRSDVRPRLAPVNVNADATPAIKAVLSDPSLRRLLLLTASVSPLVVFVFLWGAKLLVARFALPQDDVGAYLWFPPLLSDVGAVLFGLWASARLTRGRSAALPFTVAALALFVAPLAARAPTAAAAAACFGLCLAGASGLATIATNEAVRRVPPAMASTAGAVIASTQSLSFMVASFAIGHLMQVTHSYALVLVMLTACVVPGYLFGRTLGESARDS